MTTTSHAGPGGAGPGIGDRLPPLVLPRADDGARVSWRAPQRGAPVVVFLAAGDAGRDYARDLAAEEAELRVWNGRPILVLPSEMEAREIVPAGVAEALTVVADPGGVAHRRCGVEEGSAALYIADRWGQIYVAEHAPDERGLPGVGQIEEWLKYLATQCPECGVPDEPGRGEWEA
ncbi:MAG TPA: hypothetical protein VF212_11690 [Longimicrobiales bacterium]